MDKSMILEAAWHSECTSVYDLSWTDRDAIEARFTKLVYFPPCADDCWAWHGMVTPAGYGHFKINYMKYRAHRVSYELYVGPIPEGLVLDHLCRNRRCVNPSHLEPVTVKVNILRGIGLAAVNITKTHCPAGHPYDEANTRIYKGGRCCRACDVARNRLRRGK